jgi:hypothetical protein
MESIGLILGMALLASPKRRPDPPHLEASCPGSSDGSVGLAAQEGRDVENLFLDRVAYGSGAAERVEALRRCRSCLFRDRPCRSPFEMARGREKRRRTRELRRRYSMLDPVGDAAPVVAQPAGEIRE